MRTIAFFSLGCKVNIYESNALQNMFKNAGYEIVDNKEVADCYIINTCSVTNTADSKSKKTIRHAKKLNKDAIICVMGCFTQTNSDALKMDEIDILLGNGNKGKALELVNDMFVKKEREKTIELLKIRECNYYENLEATSFDHTRAFVKIEDGCSNFCTYCIIPYARGPVRSKDKDLVIKEIKGITKLGYKEVVLAGIHTGHYESGDNYKLSNLLKDLLTEVKELKRIRLSSIEINEIDDDIINLMKESKVIADHMHLPLQSGSDKILRLMNRRYDTKFFLDKINKIKEVRPDISITTDVMVGFPYEEDKDFLDCVEFIKLVNFSELHVFPFSKRSGTVAYNMPQVDEKVKKERVKTLLKLSKELSHNYYSKFINKDLEVLIENEYDENYMQGHTSNYLHVLVPKENVKANDIVLVNILGFKGDLLVSSLKN